MYSNGKSVQGAAAPLFPDIYITAFGYQCDFKAQKYKQLPSIQKPGGTAFPETVGQVDATGAPRNLLAMNTWIHL